MSPKHPNIRLVQKKQRHRRKDGRPQRGKQRISNLFPSKSSSTQGYIAYKRERGPRGEPAAPGEHHSEHNTHTGEGVKAKINRHKVLTTGGDASGDGGESVALLCNSSLFAIYTKDYEWHE